ncbi:MAG: metallophosphoesterase [Firmicutes bacterium]|nr:metallophosphoesterase [Bacillota bacterium]
MSLLPVDRLVLILLSLGLVLGLYGFLVEPGRIRIKRKDYRLEQLPPGKSLKIIHLSDLHGRLTFGPIRDLTKWINAEQTDLIAVTGDLVSRKRDIGPMVTLLSTFRARYGVFFVAGNHDHAARGTGPGARWLKADLEKVGVTVLDNTGRRLDLGQLDQPAPDAPNGARTAAQEDLEDRPPPFACAGGSRPSLDPGSDPAISPTLSPGSGSWSFPPQVSAPRGRQSLYLLGVDDPVSGRAELGQAVAGCPPGSLKILLAHSPDVVDDASTNGISVVLAGHTHGGQVCCPFLGAIVTGSRFGRRFARGEYQVRQTLLLINRGLGTTLLPLRLFCPPEIGVYCFRGEEAGRGI